MWRSTIGFLRSSGIVGGFDRRPAIEETGAPGQGLAEQNPGNNP
ncbi:MAG: hypothetical protein ACYSR7_06060 [Planctomycetota bacterium]